MAEQYYVWVSRYSDDDKAISVTQGNSVMKVWYPHKVIPLNETHNRAMLEYEKIKEPALMDAVMRELMVEYGIDGKEDVFLSISPRATQAEMVELMEQGPVTQDQRKLDVNPTVN